MSNNSRMNISQWVSGERGRSLAIARLLGITQPVVSDWCAGKKAIAAEHCKAIEQFTGGAVTCQEMRPHDWHKYWPELAVAPANAACIATETVAYGVANV